MGGMNMDLGMDMNSTCDPMMMMMKMSFFFGYQCSLLFTSFNLQTPGQLFGGIIFILILGILYEGLKTLREVLAAWEAKQTKNDSINMDKTETYPLISDQSNKVLKKVTRYVKRVCQTYCSPLHLLQSWLHVVQVGMAYILMLVAMTYNGWLFLAVCFGAGLGYFIFGKSRKISDFKSQSEHCH